MKKLFFMLMVLGIQQVMAQDNTIPDKVIPYDSNPVIVEKREVIRSHDTDVIPLNRFMHIDRILIKARSSTFCGPSNLLISVDGYQENKQSLWIPSNLAARSFIVEMKGYSGRTLQIENEGKCKVIISSIKVLPRRPLVKPGPGGGPINGDGSDISYYVSQVVDISMMLADYVSDQEVVQFLGPWKRLAGKAMATINATGPSSTKTREALIALLKVLNEHEAFIDKLISSPFTQDLGYEVMEAKTVIERSLI
ncbi:MAG: hypothetical protein ACOYL6_10350 [Bacteriovoracaceae bacterium]